MRSSALVRKKVSSVMVSSVAEASFVLATAWNFNVHSDNGRNSIDQSSRIP
jgi:hypothetical protein